MAGERKKWWRGPGGLCWGPYHGQSPSPTTIHYNYHLSSPPWTSLRPQAFILVLLRFCVLKKNDRHAQKGLQEDDIDMEASGVKVDPKSKTCSWLTRTIPNPIDTPYEGGAFQIDATLLGNIIRWLKTNTHR